MERNEQLKRQQKQCWSEISKVESEFRPWVLWSCDLGEPSVGCPVSPSGKGKFLGEKGSCSIYSR